MVSQLSGVSPVAPRGKSPALWMNEIIYHLSLSRAG